MSSVRTEYAAFNALGARSSSSEVMLRPVRYVAVGWENSGGTAQTIPQAEIHSYSAFGQPSSVTYYNDAAATEYDYDLDRLGGIAFLNDQSSATYHGTSRRLARLTSNTGQVSLYTYDAFGRLEEMSERSSNRVTRYAYGDIPSLGAGVRPWTETTVTVTPYSASEISSLTSRTYYKRPPPPRTDGARAPGRWPRRSRR